MWGFYWKNWKIWYSCWCITWYFTFYRDIKCVMHSYCALYLQVHAARLRGSQKEVVIKVLKPGVEDVLTTDLNFLYVSARVLEFLNPQLARTSLVSPCHFRHLISYWFSYDHWYFKFIRCSSNLHRFGCICVAGARQKSWVTRLCPCHTYLYIHIYEFW